MTDKINKIRLEITQHKSNSEMLNKGFLPLFTASRKSKIIIIGQAPGATAQVSGIPWNDKSGERLVEWLGVTEKQFRNPEIVSLVPMDFYYPGKGKSGDLPPRKDFAPMWHKRLLDLMPDAKLIVLIGRFAQNYYLPDNRYKTLTETVRNYEDFMPAYFPIVHPSPLNFRWFAKNKWFESELVPVLKETIAGILQN